MALWVDEGALDNKTALPYAKPDLTHSGGTAIRGTPRASGRAGMNEGKWADLRALVLQWIERNKPPLSPNPFAVARDPWPEQRVVRQKFADLLDEVSESARALW